MTIDLNYHEYYKDRPASSLDYFDCRTNKLYCSPGCALQDGANEANLIPMDLFEEYFQDDQRDQYWEYKQHFTRENPPFGQFCKICGKPFHSL